MGGQGLPDHQQSMSRQDHRQGLMSVDLPTEHEEQVLAGPPAGLMSVGPPIRYGGPGLARPPTGHEEQGSAARSWITGGVVTNRPIRARGAGVGRTMLEASCAGRDRQGTSRPGDRLGASGAQRLLRDFYLAKSQKSPLVAHMTRLPPLLLQLQQLHAELICCLLECGFRVHLLLDRSVMMWRQSGHKRNTREEQALLKGKRG